MVKSRKCLFFLKNDFKRTRHSAGWAHSFTNSAPMTIFSLDNSDLILDQYNRPTSTDTNTQPATITLFLVNRWHFNQLRLPPPYYNLIDIVMFVCNLCLTLIPLLFPQEIFYLLLRCDDALTEYVLVLPVFLMSALLLPWQCLPLLPSLVV